MDPTTITNDLTTLIAEFEAEIDPARLAAEEAEKMAPFEHEWKHAPATEKRRALKEIQAEQRARQAERLFAVGRAYRDVEPVLEGLVARERQPPSAIEAMQQRAGSKGLSLDVELGADLFDVTLTGQLLPTLKAEKPSFWLQRYERALSDSTQRHNATTVRLVEEMMSGDKWPGATINPRDEPGEAAAIQRLKRRIAAVQDGRITPDLQKALGVLKRAKAVERQAEQVRGIIPQNPELAGRR